MAVATIMDLSYKMKLIEFYYPIIYEDESVIEIKKIRKLCFDILEEYQMRSSSLRDQSLNATSFQPQESRIAKNDFLKRFDLFVSNTTNTETVKSELDSYFEEGVLPRTDNFEILSWWKENESKYPTLHYIARDVLAIPVSTVASESAFSTSGRFVSPHRSRLHPKTLEALMCAQDWLWAEIKDPSLVTQFTRGSMNEDVDADQEPCLTSASP